LLAWRDVRRDRDLFVFDMYDRLWGFDLFPSRVLDGHVDFLLGEIIQFRDDVTQSTVLLFDVAHLFQFLRHRRVELLVEVLSQLVTVALEITLITLKSKKPTLFCLGDEPLELSLEVGLELVLEVVHVLDFDELGQIRSRERYLGLDVFFGFFNLWCVDFQLR
jgi:hypothetical protein